MATSVLKIYNSKISRDRNCKVDNISGYLGSLSPVYTCNDFQYIKLGLNLSIKLILDQSKVGQSVGNYIDLYQDGKHFYFFINSSEWKAVGNGTTTGTVLLNLTMDTVNTFASDFTFNKKTTIHRQHKNRIERKEYPTVLPFEDNTDGDTMSGLSEYLLDTLPSYLLWSADYLFAEDNNKKFKVVHYDAEGFAVESWEGKNFRYTLEDGGTYYLRDYQGTEVFWEITLVDLREAYNNGEYYVLQAPGKYEFKDEDAPGINTFLSQKRSRFSPVEFKYFRKIDIYPEGINPQLYNVSDRSDVYDAVSKLYPDLKWYLWYQNTAQTTPEDPVQPVECLLYASYPIAVKMPASVTEWDYTNFTDGKYYYFMPKKVDTYPDEVPGGNINLNFYEGDNYNNTFKISQLKKNTSWISGIVSIKPVSYAVVVHRVGSTLEVLQFAQNNKSGGFHVTKKCASTTKIGIKDAPKDVIDNGMTAIVLDTYEEWVRDIIEDPNVVTFTLSSVMTPTTIPALPEERDDSKIIKIFELPYCPSDIALDENEDLVLIPNYFYYDAEDGVLKSRNLNDTFTNSLQCDYSPENVCYLFEGINPTFSVQDRDDNYESKLFSSEFYLPRFIYDSFTYTFPLEQLEIPKEESAKTEISFFVTSTVNSRFMFRFDSLTWKYATNDFPNYLVTNRQNEIATFNSSYLDYVRNGYNYDVKNKNIALGKGVVNTAVGTVAGAAAGALKGGVVGAIVGGVTSAAGGIYNTVLNQVQAENAIQQKLQETSSQATSVNGCDDIDLMRIYTDNDKASISLYRCSERVRNMVADLFYYCGYADNVQEVPNLNSRRFFNYIQCDAVFNEEINTPYREYLEDIKSRYSEGITVYHKYSQGALLPDIYDWEQKYENWETSF